MIEELKELEQQAMDNLSPETYEAIVNDVFGKYDQETFLAGYIDGLQAAIGILSNNSSTMSYTMEIDEMFGEDYARIDEDEDAITN